EFIENQIEVRKIESGVPKWVIPAFLGTTIVFIAALVIVLIPPPEERPIGLLFDDKDPELTFIMEEELNLEASVLEGFDQPFEDFVMRYNAKESGLDISNDKDMWDDVFYKKTIGAVTHFAKYKSFWKTFEESLQDYSTVVSMLREDGLPEVFAAIPVQETRYNAKALSPVCAAGIWQFMPEVGNRVGLKIRGCTLSGVGSVKDWKPTRDAAPNVAKTDYVRKEMKASGFKYICKIKSCKEDERIDVEASTTGAIKLLHEAWDDDELKESGSIVQMTIVAHNVGYHDAKFGQKRSTNILPGYRKYSKKSKREHGTHFYGDNIRCGSDKDPHEPQYYASRCGGVIPNQGQHYGYNVVAQHMLAVCYYAQNYGTETVFRPWKTYLNGYCSNIEIPTPEQLEK
ncbi:MAG: transglycosylase SLT domain-containing protein, partial [Myxococcota bacterium]|nr:transglycosylase SLT domain-containing protein [Myxococcota bacterium]